MVQKAALCCMPHRRTHAHTPHTVHRPAHKWRKSFKDTFVIQSNLTNIYTATYTHFLPLCLSVAWSRLPCPLWWTLRYWGTRLTPHTVALVEVNWSRVFPGSKRGLCGWSGRRCGNPAFGELFYSHILSHFYFGLKDCIILNRSIIFSTNFPSGLSIVDLHWMHYSMPIFFILYGPRISYPGQVIVQDQREESNAMEHWSCVRIPILTYFILYTIS